MADVYANGSASAGGDGSSGDPYDSLADAVANAGNGDTVHLADIFRESASFSSLSGVTIQQWAGQTQAEVRGDTIVASGSWSDEGGDVFEATIAGTATSVVWNWDDNIDSDGRHFGHLRPGTFDSLNVGEWAQSGATLQIRIDTGAGMEDPTAGGEYAFTDTTDFGIEMSGCSACAVNGIEFKLWSDNTGAQGYGLKFTSCTDCTTDACVTWDSGAHSIGFVNATADMGSARITNCACWGLHGGSSGQNHLVFFSNNSGDDIDDAVASDCTLHLYGSLDVNGEPIDARGRNITGTFQHQGTGASISKIVWERINCIGYDGNLSQPFGNSDETDTPGDAGDYETYAIQYIDCTAVNCTRMVYGVLGDYSAAWVRCFFDLQRASIFGGEGSSNIAKSMRLGGLSSTTGTNYYLFQACVIIGDLREFYNSGGSFVGAGSGTHYPDEDGSVLTNVVLCSVHEACELRSINSNWHVVTDASAATYETFWGVTSSSVIVLTDSVFTSTSTHHLGVGGNQTLDNIDESDGNLFFRVDENEYWASGTTFDTESDWETLVDVNGFYAQDPGIDGIDDSGTPTATGYSSGQLTLESLSPDTDGWVYLNPQARADGAQPQGINGQLYSGHLGAFQFGGTGATTRQNGQRRLVALPGKGVY